MADVRYLPGDIVNGYFLSEAGNWLPCPPGAAERHARKAGEHMYIDDEKWTWTGDGWTVERADVLHRPIRGRFGRFLDFLAENDD